MITTYHKRGVWFYLLLDVCGGDDDTFFVVYSGKEIGPSDSILMVL